MWLYLEYIKNYVSLQHQSINQRKVTKIEREKQIFYITKNR